jgi:hypothetical protein
MKAHQKLNTIARERMDKLEKPKLNVVINDLIS